MFYMLLWTHRRENVDYAIMNLTQLERVKSELKRRKYEQNKISGNFVIILNSFLVLK